MKMNLNKKKKEYRMKRLFSIVLYCIHSWKKNILDWSRSSSNMVYPARYLSKYISVLYKANNFNIISYFTLHGDFTTDVT